MRKYLGCCLCGAVQYSFLGANLLAYECHCSVCQKVSGSAFSATVLCAEDSFQWLKGSELIKSYSRDNGYKTHFCTQCGNQVPNQFRNYPLMSVPLGSINDSVDILVAVKLHLASTPKWVLSKNSAKAYSEMPSLSEIFKHLHLQE